MPLEGVRHNGSRGIVPRGCRGGGTGAGEGGAVEGVCPGVADVSLGPAMAESLWLRATRLHGSSARGHQGRTSRSNPRPLPCQGLSAVLSAWVRRFSLPRGRSHGL